MDINTANPGYQGGHTVPERPPEIEKRGISGSTLKLVAVITMLIDHIGAAVLIRMIYAAGFWEMQGQDSILSWLPVNVSLAGIYNNMREIGRIAFPIYCFLLVEGFQKTHDVKKYALRLGLFALISEIPFDLAFNSKVLEFGYQNVFFTLFIGLLTMIVFDTIEKKLNNLVVRYLLQAAAIAAGAVIAGLMRTDYAAEGVLCIMIIYLFRKRRLLQVIIGYLAFIFFLQEITALPAFILIWFYNGKRGWNLKYLFYAFYPLHLLILYGICIIMGISGIPAL